MELLKLLLRQGLNRAAGFRFTFKLRDRAHKRSQYKTGMGYLGHRSAGCVCVDSLAGPHIFTGLSESSDLLLRVRIGVRGQGLVGMLSIYTYECPHKGRNTSM